MWYQEHQWLSARWLSLNARLVCLQHRFATRYTSQYHMSIPKYDEREYCTHLQHYRFCHLRGYGSHVRHTAQASTANQQH